MELESAHVDLRRASYMLPDNDLASELPPARCHNLWFGVIAFNMETYHFTEDLPCDFGRASGGGVVVVRGEARDGRV